MSGRALFDAVFDIDQGCGILALRDAEGWVEGVFAGVADFDGGAVGASVAGVCALLTLAGRVIPELGCRAGTLGGAPVLHADPRSLVTEPQLTVLGAV